jgi:cytochrome P450
VTEPGQSPAAPRAPSVRGVPATSPGRATRSVPGRLTALLLRDPYRGLPELARERGDVASVRIGPRRVVLVSHPEGVRQVLALEHELFTKGGTLGGLRVLLGEGLITSDGPRHAAQRRALQGHFGRGHEGAWQAAVMAATARGTGAWRDGEGLEMQAEMLRLSLDVTARTLFGEVLSDDDLARLARATGTISEISSLTSLPWLEGWVRTPLRPFRRFRAARAELRTWAQGLLARAREVETGSGGPLHAIAASAPAATGDPVDQVLTLLMAAHVTTGHALAWAVHRLAGQPGVADALAAEAVAALGAGGDDAEAADGVVASLPYARAVFAETLRLHPPAWAIGREARRPTAVEGHAIGRADMVLLSPWVTQRDARWFERPAEFRPERWLDGDASPSRFSFFPFGLGPRRCVGEPLAWLEGTLVLGLLGQAWRFERDGPAEPRLRPGVTLAAQGGLRVRVRAR